MTGQMAMAIRIICQVLQTVNQILQKTPAKYPYTGSEIRMNAIPQGQVSFTFDNVCQGRKPNRLIVGFVNSSAVSGNYTLSPYNFAGYDLRQINVFVDGQPVLGNAMKVSSNSVTGVDTVEPLLWMLKSYGKWGKDAGNQLTVSDINNGFAIYVFDLEPSFPGRDYIHLLKQGIVRIEAHFDKPLPHPVTCITLAENLNYFEINLAREVVVYK